MGTDAPRRIVLTRHAKAEPNGPDDHERPLSAAGRLEAPGTGRWLAAAGIAPGLALVSTARRARETWELIVPELPAPPPAVFEDRVYEAEVADLLALVGETPDEVSGLLVLGHNPGVHELADALVGESDGDLLDRMDASEFPNSAVAVLEFTGSWKDLDAGLARLVAFRTPEG
ncbi:SixA phosphatase family protein [Kitasatospora arboriphila]